MRLLDGSIGLLLLATGLILLIGTAFSDEARDHSPSPEMEMVFGFVILLGGVRLLLHALGWA